MSTNGASRIATEAHDEKLLDCSEENGRPKEHADHAADPKKPVFEAYGQPDWPMGAYIGLVGTYVTAVTAFIAITRKSGVELPERISPADILLLAIATQKFSRLLTKDWVLAPLRAPFTQYEGPGGPAEVREKPRGQGLQLAIGELLTCPWCASQWTATIFTCGLLLRPRLVRLLCSILTTVAVSDFLNLAYCAAEERA